MPHPELAHLELLAELDSLTEALGRWADSAPAWQPAEICRALVRRLLERTASMRIRLEAPLVVATLGGTGTGKSALVSALVGEEVTEIGRSRPTTTQPRLICRADLTPQLLGIDPKSVELIQRDLPALSDLVLIDCPDPDTTEDADAGQTNLARLRHLLPHCDVLLVATTQQKYRSARVADELRAAASGARLVFVQTHADMDEDIREDWRNTLDEEHDPGHIFLVDSPGALADIREGLKPRGEFGELIDLLTRQLAGSAAVRVRRANLLDLVAETLGKCQERIDRATPPIRKLEAAIEQHRVTLVAQLAEQMRAELTASRRQWESRLLGKIASRWGFSPFALVLRVFQGIGGLASGTFLVRARTPAQMALWGAMEGARSWQRRRSGRKADQSADRAVAECWSESDLRRAAVVLDGFALEAELSREGASLDTIRAEAGQAGQDFVADVSAALDALLGRAADRHTGWFTRWRYELALAVVLGALLFRLGKNFFYDSWIASAPVPTAGMDLYLLSAFWLFLWCGVLIWSFSSRLRRGLRRQIDQLAESWKTSQLASGVFAQLESECTAVHRFRDELTRLEQRVKKSASESL